MIPTPLSPSPPVSLAENSNDIELELVLVPLAITFLFPSVADSRVVLGEIVSMVQVNDAGKRLMFPTLSIDLTLNVWVPSFKIFRNTNGLVHATYLELSNLH